jgi:hypothetical protein
MKEQGALVMRIRHVGKAGVVGGLAAALFAGSVATAAFVQYGSFFVGGGRIDHLSPLSASDGSITGPLMPGESADVAFTIVNPNRVSVLAKVTSPDAGAVEITEGPESCAQYLSYTGQGAGYGPEAWRGSVPANGTMTVSAADWVTLAGDPPSTCQDAKFKVRFTVSAERNTTYAQ